MKKTTKAKILIEALKTKPGQMVAKAAIKSLIKKKIKKLKEQKNI